MSRTKRTLVTALAAAVLTVAGFALPSGAGAVTGATTEFVAGFEGFVPCVYPDPAGHATIGYGHLIHLGAPTRKDRRKWGCITQTQGLRLLRRDLKSSEDQVLTRVRGTPLTASMLTALTSFAFNLGAGALDRNRHLGSGKITNIAARVRHRRYRLAGREMLLYNGAIIGGKRHVLPGLVIRRRKEYRLMIRDIGRVNRNCSVNCGPGRPGGTGNGGITIG